MAEPQPFVTIEAGTPAADIRWTILRMFAGRTYGMRLAAAREVMKSDSDVLTTEHLDMAQLVADRQDPLSLKAAAHGTDG